MEFSVGDARKLVLEPARLSELGDFGFCIGPYGNKVGFAFQQKRALNVAFAAHQLSEIVKPGSRVAILGGGLAGTTACVALAGMGVMAEVFETRDRVLKLQLQALHRLLHPCYNSWPMTARFASSTSNPFLNWYVDTAKRVTDALFEEWETQFKPELPKPKTRCAIKKVEKCSVDKDGVVVHYEHTLEDNTVSLKKEEFDAVFVALGFGEEVDLDLSDESTYWVPDAIGTFREREEDAKFIVSGTGDGGLIDCGRFMYRKVEGGKLLIEVIAALRHRTYQKPPTTVAGFDEYVLSQTEENIRNLEQRIESKNMEFDPEFGDPDLHFGTTKQNAIAVELAKGYEKIIAALPAGCLDILDAALYKPERVTLVGNLEAPFSPNAAPINKLLMAHALSVRPEIYVRGRVEEFRGEPYIRHPDGRRKKIKADRKVVRHGTKAPIRELFESFDIEVARKTHTLQNVIDVKLPPAAFSSALPDVVRDQPDDFEYVKARLAKAESFAKKVLGTAVEPDWDNESKSGTFVVETNDAYLKSSKKTGGFDRELFGIPLISQKRSDRDTYVSAVKAPG
ncbi:hypothetical protein [Thalassococcus lentus]|uniref:FAD/NAD(P)-binding domain-containing protein n=1 Tax=Thalassococcus lentus TaxID=1210524 RepID=A0ABT4XUE9_9RHOB|nr:hypothetical protein [Thalassococcus lentus]MDA7425601.1 hypothetical protein [Thalassococcus lentus]